MPVDPSIPLAAQGPQPVTLNSIAQLMQMQQEAQQMKQSRAIQNSLAAIYANPQNLGPDGMPNAQAIQQIGKISPQTAQQLTTQRATVDEKLALTGNHQLEAQKAARDLVQDTVYGPALNAYDSALAQGKTPQQAKQIAQGIYSQGMDDAFASGAIPDEAKARAPRDFDPVRVRASSLSYKDQKTIDLKQNEQADTNAYRQDQLKLEQERARLEAARLAREKEADTVGGQLSAEAIKDAAARYNLDGTLPPLGMGKQGLSVRNAILNTAADLQKGVDPTDQRVNQLAGKAAGQARGQLEKTVNNIQLAEKTALGSADMLSKSSASYDRSSSPMINRSLNEFRSQVEGDPKFAAYAANLNTFKNEYTKVMTGAGQATDAARAEADHLVNTNMSHEQLMAGMDQLKQEMQNVRENAIKAARQESGAQTKNPETGGKTLTYDPATGTFK